MTDSPRTFHEALAFARGERDHPTQWWEGACQKFVRSSYGLPGLYLTAYAQWLGADPEDRHATTDLSTAPVGAALCSKGSNPAGHIWLAANPFLTTGVPGSFSTDIARTGHVDKCARTAPQTAWGHQPLGYLTSVNGYDLQLGTTKPAAPKQDKLYQSIERAIGPIEHALSVAKNYHDHADARVLRRELDHLHAMYGKLRHS